MVSFIFSKIYFTSFSGPEDRQRVFVNLATFFARFFGISQQQNSESTTNTCPSCPNAPTCQVCRTCPVCAVCPTCEVCQVCPVCPDCPTCPDCPVCPDCPTCPVETQPVTLDKVVGTGKLNFFSPILCFLSNHKMSNYYICI